MNITKCFLIEETNKIKRELRRYQSQTKTETPCPGPMSYHNACVFLDIIEGENKDGEWSHEDPLWPTECVCGYKFTEQDEWQLFTSRIYRRTDTGEEIPLRDAPGGAIWHAQWLDKFHQPTPDGKVYAVKLPNLHTWIIDSQASNCTMPDDKTHKCWVRHGEPPMFTVDKNGHTCAAGAGSILAGGWHGFLINGELREC